jgi:sugar phosphate isomerase/epimerase
VRRTLEDHGLRLERLVTSIHEPDAETEKLLEAAREAGLERIRIGGYSMGSGEFEGKNPRDVLAVAQAKLPGLGKLLAKHGVKGGIQKHSGHTLDVNISSCLLMLRDCDPEWVGVQYDPGHCTLSGEAPKLAVGLLGPRLQSVNLKSPRQEYCVDPDTGRLTYRATWVPLRDGMLDVPAVLAALAAAGHGDPLSIHAEYRSHFYMVEQDVDATTALIAEDVRYVRALMGAG